MEIDNYIHPDFFNNNLDEIIEHLVSIKVLTLKKSGYYIQETPMTWNNIKRLDTDTVKMFWQLRKFAVDTILNNILRDYDIKAYSFGSV